MKIKGSHLFLVLWKTFRSVEKFDHTSISEQGFNCLSDFAVLEVLKTKGASSVATIGEKVLLTSGSITSAIKRAEEKNFVTKSRDKADKRIVTVDLTKQGKEHITKAFNKHENNLEKLFSPLKDKEKQELLRLLKKVGKLAETLTP